MLGSDSSYPSKSQLETIYTEYLKAQLMVSYKSHAVWGSERNLKQLAKSSVEIYEQVGILFFISADCDELFLVLC